MRLSQRGEYALRALVALGLRHGEAVVTIRSVAESQRIPRRFLEQILNELKEAGFLESRRGVRGGYRLARRPSEISLADVVRCVDGPMGPIGCVLERSPVRCSCPDPDACGVRSIMREVRDGLVRDLERLTVADLCARSTSLKVPPGTAFPEYVI